ncbi:hypothetical protein TSUD_172800 [Trifolium subterraneum]|uniref:Uncharacterized protein n=1 Tax=Trifolium subterraneum TaxID=3900 RepID=A0A2Z6LUY0_TRISU|nr:hypothetical protein TSUD_172800 [Trifolium subterraneum]
MQIEFAHEVYIMRGRIQLPTRARICSYYSVLLVMDFRIDHDYKKIEAFVGSNTYYVQTGLCIEVLGP